MKGVIIDTSSIKDLITINLDKISPGEIIKLSPVLESLILYDDLWYDAFSIRSMDETLQENGFFDTSKRLVDIRSTTNPLEEDESSQLIIYEGILTLFKTYLETDLAQNYQPDQSNILLTDLYNYYKNFYPDKIFSSKIDDHNLPEQVFETQFSAYVEYLENNLSDKYRSQLTSCVETFNKLIFGRENTEGFSVALPIIRIFYYQILQRKYSLHFTPHYSKATFINKSEKSYGKSLVDFFDGKVRQEFLTRKKTILGEEDLYFTIPMISSYLLKGVKDWDELRDRILELRNSKRAINFRAAIHEMTGLLESRNNIALSKILNEIKSAAEDWQAGLEKRRNTKNIKVSVPVIGIGTDIDIPTPKLTLNVSDDLLVFIHELLAKS